MSSESLADTTQRDWIRACRELGLEVLTNRGKGGHILIKHPTNGAKYTIQSHLHKIANKKILQALQAWGFSEEQVLEALR